MVTYDAIDLFGGPGGWDLAAVVMGLHVLGIEWDDAACATRIAAGLATLQGDVSQLDPMTYAKVRGLIASPPCPSFSAGGKRLGEQDKPDIQRCLQDLANGRDTRSQYEWADERSVLSVEPLRWALAMHPTWICCEQVPPALELWEWTADHLRAAGYSVWTGVLNAEQYGVPQTRKRAVLIARRDGVGAGKPPPTHQRYLPAPKESDAPSLFDPPARERIVHPDDTQLQPWVSMAEALGWGMTARPYPVIASSRSTGGPDREKVGGSGAREALYDERDAGRWTMRSNDRTNGTVRGAEEPAATITASRDWRERQWVVQTRRGGDRIEESTSIEDPSPTITTRTDRWQVKPTHYNARDQRDGHTGKPNRMRQVDEPAQTIAGESRNDTWAHERPATTVAGDNRVHPPGHKTNRHDPPGKYDGRAGENAIRVSEDEAAVLQGFPADYPWQGTRTKQFQQIGNAVPPPLAWAVLSELVRVRRGS